jgi:hypothetical protein
MQRPIPGASRKNPKYRRDDPPFRDDARPLPQERRLRADRFLFSRRGFGTCAAFRRKMQEVAMGYEGNDRRYGYGSDRGYGGPDRGWERDRSGDGRTRFSSDYGTYGGSSPSRDYRGDRFNAGREDYRSDYRSDDYRAAGWSAGDYGFGRDRRDRDYDDRDRGFFERAGDEVRSWFGDEEAEHRRREDQRYDRPSGWNYGSERGYRSRHEHDPHYRNWRDRQLEALDRDYDDYRREHQNRFDTEFGSWRQTRQGQRQLLQRVQEHQEVVGSDGEHIGTVDHVRSDRILLTKSDADARGHHHSIPSAWITSVEDKVTVNKTADQARQHWRDEERNSDGGLFGRDREEDRDRSVDLNRSFSGTY